MKSEFEELRELIDNLYNEVYSMEYDDEVAEATFYKTETKFEELEQNNWEKLDLSELRKKMKYVKKELNLYDEENELDRMQPNRHSSDFDEDELNGESFFKD